MRPLTTPKTVLLIALCGLAGLLVVGCGGGADENSDPQELLNKTFNGEGEQVKSGVLDVSLEASSQGNGGGSLNAALSGPFETRDSGELPLVDFDVSLQVKGGQSTSFDGGLTITADGAYVGVKGQEYAVDKTTFDTFSQLFAQSSAQQDQQGNQGAALLRQLGIDPANWLTDVKNEGTEEVGGTETVHISGTPDVAQIVADAQSLDPTGSALGGSGAKQLSDAVKSASVDVYTGVDDNVLRRLDVGLEIEDPGQSGGTLSLKLSITISDLNGDQTIEAPANAKPIDKLIPGGLGALGGGLGALGGAGSVPGVGSGGAGGGGSSGGAGGSGGGAVGGFTPEYQDCISKAKTPDDFASCNDLLN